MIEARGTTVIELDERASEPYKPFGIVTADCSGAHEFDDGIAVTPLPSAQELYRVHVFAADTSRLYRDDEVVKRVLKRTESTYAGKPGNDETYKPMLARHDIDRLHFKEGEIRKALSVSFIIGAFQQPTDVAINFGKVEVVKNYRYDTFGQKCRYSDNLQPIGRVAALIMKHLHAPEDPEEALYRDLIHVPREENFRRGNNINQSFMIAGNFLPAQLMRNEGRLALYRVNDREDDSFTEFLSPRNARFSTNPGPHDGLGLPIYTRITSPLRRGEDFVMHGLLRARHEGRELDGRDERIVKAMVQRLNQRVIISSHTAGVSMKDEDLWYRPAA